MVKIGLICGWFLLFHVTFLAADHCFNAQVQDSYLIAINRVQVFHSLFIRTLNDTTAVKQRFHVDYFHPKDFMWASYQENRRTMFYTFPPVSSKGLNVTFTDRIVAKSLRISLKKTSALSWLGEICVNIDVLELNEKPVPCEEGFYGGQGFCIDINECADNTGNFCPPGQHCVDYPGSYACPGTCLENKLPNKKTLVCEDHCYHKGYLCHPKARCLYGKCVCSSGYEGDGIYCLDSCTAKGFTCDSNANCAEGKCKCRSGYQGNGEICQAICYFNLMLCHPDAVCHMNACKCKPGYVGNGISKCIFSRKLYEEELKKQGVVQTRLDVVETDVLEVIHAFQRLRSVLNKVP